MTEHKVGITRVPLETVDLATPGLGWAGHLGTVLTHLQQRRGWAGLGWAGLGWAGGPSAARTEHSLTC